MEQELYRQPRSGNRAQDVDGPRGFDAGRLVTLAGAATSAALMVGLAVWGYKLAVRDVQGVPVLQALEGPARDTPKDPEGEFARHTGLAVNAVAAEGTAAPPPETIALAPAPDDLLPEVAPMGELAAPAAILPAAEAPLAAPPVAEPAVLPAETLASLIPAPAALDPAGAFAAGAAEQPLPEAIAEAVTAEDLGPLPASVPGVASSPRPPARPVRLDTRVVALVPAAAPSVANDAGAADDPIAAAVAAAVAVAIAAPGPARELDPATLAPGTPLVQVGAFDDPETARGEWTALEARFAAIMAGKDRVIEATESGGRRFYRLRVAGFADADEATRFCAVLLESQVNCISAWAR